MRINTNQQDLVDQEYWLPMQNTLGDNLTEYIRHYLTKMGKVVK